MARKRQFGIKHVIILTTIVGYVVAGTNRENPLGQVMLFVPVLTALMFLAFAFFLFVIGVKLDGDLPRYFRRRRESRDEESP